MKIRKIIFQTELFLSIRNSTHQIKDANDRNLFQNVDIHVKGMLNILKDQNRHKKKISESLTNIS